MTLRTAIRCILALAVAALISGCRKEAQPLPQAAVSDPNAPSARIQPPAMAIPPRPATITDTEDAGAALRQLSIELRKYVLRTRTAPKTFEEFIAATHIQAPPAPVGKKYAIQGGAVVLVNR